MGLPWKKRFVELRATLQKPRVAALIKPYKAGRLINQIKNLAENIADLPRGLQGEGVDRFRVFSTVSELVLTVCSSVARL
ncbi:MAG TPA: hypothetical protein VMH48_07550 [Methylomirabilota bacterium]|nr:hypothetical protein [Methylomirabilota bacterium]